MRLIGLMLALLILLTGCGGDEPPATTLDAETILATRTAMFTAVPTPRPTATPLANSADPLTIVLGGEYRRGGYWTWDDIANLLGVYETYGAFTTVTADGQDYDGVPIAYLLDWAQINPGARGTVVFSRTAGSFNFTTQELQDCEEDCVIARTASNTLALVMLGRTPAVIDDLVRIESR